MRQIATPFARAFIVTSLLAAAASAQSFVSTPGQLPTGSTNNGGYTENVDFADIDGDGDRDMFKADGGDFGNQRSRLWINMGGLQGGTIGFFQDETVSRTASVLNASRDLDFVDIDADGDFDAYLSNTAQQSPQSNRFLVNMGGAQGGTPGYFQDQSLTRWTYIAVNDGVTHFSSIPTSQVFVNGGFTDWSCDCVFGDLDADGDQDLFHSSYGSALGGLTPSRVFLNDGAGFFEEFNPSHLQLASTQISNGQAALWCEGTHQNGTTNTSGAQADVSDNPLGAELGDVDGDLDLDVLQGARTHVPRLYQNRLAENGTLGFRDVTYASFVQFADTLGNYEQELGDMDNDDDLDIYGLNWPGFDDCTVPNDGTGHFGAFTVMANSGDDDNEPDWFDSNNDGYLDVWVADFSGQDRLYRNGGPGSGWAMSDVTASEVSIDNTRSLGADSCDVDLDGDYDVMVANDSNQAEQLFKNVGNVPDAIAPHAAKLEQVANRAAGPTATRVRCHVYDNASWDVLRYDSVVLEYSWTAGSLWHSTPMEFSGAQIFSGWIRGDIAGTIVYRVRAADEHGNSSVSAQKSYTATGCTGNVYAYCTAGTTSSGCVPLITGIGTPSASAGSGFTISASAVEGLQSGLIFYGTSGVVASTWGTSSSFMCVKAPLERGPVTNSGGAGAGCVGTLSLDWNLYVATHAGAIGVPFSGGETVYAQAWFRDPPTPKTTNLSGGLSFIVCP